MKKKIFILFLGSIICLAPIVTLIIVSNKEKEQFKMNSIYDMSEKAYGELVSPIRDTVREYYEFKIEVISNEIRFMKVPKCNYDKVRWLVDLDDEICTGEKIGFCEGQVIYSSCDGIIKEMNLMNEEPYIKVSTFGQLKLKVQVPMDMERKLKEVMYDENGVELVRNKISRQYVDGYTTALYKIKDAKNYRYGQVENKFKMYTGEEYKDVLMLSKNCIYQKDNGDSYVRICSEQREFIEERQVEVGFEVGNNITVIGVNEGEKCDSGYSYVINGDTIPADEEIEDYCEE